MKKILNDIVTGKNNETIDIARLLWLITSISLMLGWAWDIIHNDNIHMIDFAQSIAILAGAFGASLYMKKDTEPTDSKDDKKD